jgi:hypothetical protein
VKPLIGVRDILMFSMLLLLLFLLLLLLLISVPSPMKKK